MSSLLRVALFTSRIERRKSFASLLDALGALITSRVFLELEAKSSMIVMVVDSEVSPSRSTILQSEGLVERIVLNFLQTTIILPMSRVGRNRKKFAMTSDGT